MRAAEAPGFYFHHNTVTNVDGGASSIAMFAFGASGVMEYNTVSYANDALSANWSRGINFLNNTVSHCGSGVHTDNNGGYGGVADLIQDNLVEDSAANGYGVWVFFPYFNPVVNHNTVNNCDVGLFAWGGAGTGSRTATSPITSWTERAAPGASEPT